MSKNLQEKKNSGTARRFQLIRRASRIMMMQFLYRCEAQKDWSLPDSEVLEDFHNLLLDVDQGFPPFPEQEESESSAPTNIVFLDDDEEEAEAEEEPVADTIVEQGFARLREFLPRLLDSLDQIDQLISAAAVNWSLRRMVSLDRNIIRVAVFEMMLQDKDEIKPGIAINEAIELSKIFGEHDSPRFVNGVLDRIRMQLNPKA